MNKLNFDEDYNHKLILDYFTGIMPLSMVAEKGVFPNTSIEVTLNGDYRGFAAIISVTPLDLNIPFEELSPIVAAALSMDTGLHPKDAYAEIKANLGTQVALVLFGW